MDNQELVEDLNQNFKKNRDFRVSKPHIWICPDKPKKRLVWPTNWVLDSNDVAVMMDKPNDIALYSNIASTQIDEAEMYYTEYIFPYGKKRSLRTVSVDEQKAFYNYFEKAIVSVTQAYTSLEAMANIFIPENYEVKKKEKNEIVKIWNKSAIELTYSLRDKFKDILRDVLKTSDPTQEKWWPTFIELEDLRNEIIHSKSSKSEDRYTKLLDTRIFRIVRNHKTVIEFYGKHIDSADKGLRNLFPYGFGMDTVLHRNISESTYDETWKDLTNPS